MQNGGSEPPPYNEKLHFLHEFNATVLSNPFGAKKSTLMGGFLAAEPALAGGKNTFLPVSVGFAD